MSQSLSKLDLCVYRVTTYLIYPFYIGSLIVNLVYDYPYTDWLYVFLATISSILFWGLHKKYEYAFYIQYLVIFLIMAGSILMIVHYSDVLQRTNEFEIGRIIFSLNIIVHLLLSIFLMYKWWDVRPLFIGDKSEKNNQIESFKRKFNMKIPLSLKHPIVMSVIIVVLGIITAIWYYRYTDPYNQCQRAFKERNPKVNEIWVIQQCNKIIRGK